MNDGTQDERHGKSLGVLPARYGSSRFPGKPLVDLDGHPMIVRAAHQAMLSTLDEVLVATDDERILHACAGHGIPARMTSPLHESGTDRVAEVAQSSNARWIVNIQGDEPLIDPKLIDQALAALRQVPEPALVTACTALDSDEQWYNPNCVKVVLRPDGYAETFFRKAEDLVPPPLPTSWPKRILRHIGLYGTSRDTLLAFTHLPPSPLERRHHLEQFRALENGIPVFLVVTDYAGHGVDTPDDVLPVLNLLRQGTA